MRDNAAASLASSVGNGPLSAKSSMLVPPFSTILIHWKASSGLPEAPATSFQTCNFQARKPGACGKGGIFILSASLILVFPAVVSHGPAGSSGWAPAAAQAKVPLVADAAEGDGEGDADIPASEGFWFSGTFRAGDLLSADSREWTDRQSSYSPRAASLAEPEDLSE